MFRVLALRWGESTKARTDSLQRRASTRNVSFQISLRWLIHITNSVDKTKITLSECFAALKTFKKNKTPGNDGLTVELQYRSELNEHRTCILNELLTR